MGKHCSCCDDIEHQGLKSVPYCGGGDFVCCNFQCKYFPSWVEVVFKGSRIFFWTNQVIKAIEQQRINRWDVFFGFAVVCKFDFRSTEN